MRVALSLSLLALLVCATHAQSSYEMILMTAPYADVVYRYDPENNIFLGSFGGSVLNNPRGIAVNAALGTAYVGDGNIIAKFNYHTGRYLGSIAVPVLTGTVRSLSLAPDGNLVVTDGTDAVKMSTTGSLMVNLTPYSSNTVGAVYQRANGQFWMLTTNAALGGAYITNHNASGVGTGYLTLETGFSSLTGYTVGGIALASNGKVVTTLYNGAGQQRVYTMSFSEGGGFTTPQTVFYPVQGARSTLSNPVLTHAGDVTYHFTRDTSGSPDPHALLSSVNTVSGHETETWLDPGPLKTEIGSGGGDQIAIVLAPEPGTLLGAAAGLGFLLKRRRRR